MNLIYFFSFIDACIRAQKFRVGAICARFMCDASSTKFMCHAGVSATTESVINLLHAALAPEWEGRKPGIVFRKDPALPPSSKIAAFDLDETLIFIRSMATVPKDDADWRIRSRHTRDVLHVSARPGDACAARWASERPTADGKLLRA